MVASGLDLVTKAKINLRGFTLETRPYTGNEHSLTPHLLLTKFTIAAMFSLLSRKLAMRSGGKHWKEDSLVPVMKHFCQNLF